MQMLPSRRKPPTLGGGSRPGEVGVRVLRGRLSRERGLGRHLGGRYAPHGRQDGLTHEGEARAHLELRHDARAVLIAAAEGLIVHLGRWDTRARQVVLVQAGRGRRVEQRVDVTDRLVRAGPLLQVDRGRVRGGGVHAGHDAVGEALAHRGGEGSRCGGQGVVHRAEVLGGRAVARIARWATRGCCSCRLDRRRRHGRAGGRQQGQLRGIRCRGGREHRRHRARAGIQRWHRQGCLRLRCVGRRSSSVGRVRVRRVCGRRIEREVGHGEPRSTLFCWHRRGPSRLARKQRLRR